MKNVIIRPILTEKTTKLAKIGHYAFYTSRNSSKGSIARDISRIFGVKVLSVKTLSVKGKVKKSLSKKGREYRRPRLKKAFISLKEGQKISLFEPKDKKSRK